MENCKLCNSELEEYVFHEGARDEPATVRHECPACGPVEINKEAPGVLQ